MNIVPPSERAEEFRVTTRPKAVVITAISAGWLVVSIAAWSCDYSRTIRVLALLIQALLLVGSVCLWRFERPREVRIQGDFREPPVIHGR
jgi:hypothetical protein